MSRRLVACVATSVAGVLISASAGAQSKGFALNRFAPSERGSDWFTAESLDLRGQGRFAAGLVLDYSHKPLVFYSRDGEHELAGVVSDQFYGHFGGAVNLWDRVRFALDFPVALYQTGDGVTTTTGRFELGSHVAAGDVRLGADVRLAGEYGKGFELATGVQVHTPTGSRDAYASDGSTRIVPRAMIAGEISETLYAATLGMNIRTQADDFAGASMGSEATFAIAGGQRLDKGRIVLGPEFYGSTVVTNSSAFFAKRTTPFEFLLGGHYAATKSVRVGTGIGPGLTRAFGTPMLRVVASLEWVEPMEEPPPPPPPPPKDRDGDKILDKDDACPDEPGVKTDDPKTNGCPKPADIDSDGIVDAEDACPTEPGVKTDDPKTNGCPPPKDRDADKIIDDEDACPDEPGEKNDDPKKNGCPPPKDSDGDGILDPEDACPKDPGPKNDDPKKNGCPVAHVEKGQIVIREQVQFAYNSAQILKTSDFILEAVTKILTENPQITKIEVQGHTDNKGNAKYNKKLSEQRAASVMAWLGKHGIDKARLVSHGYGMDQPIDTNDTEEGRANNRRVEFHIMDQKAAEDAAPAPAPAAPAPKAAHTKDDL